MWQEAISPVCFTPVSYFVPRDLVALESMVPARRFVLTFEFGICTRLRRFRLHGRRNVRMKQVILGTVTQLLPRFDHVILFASA